MHSGQGLSALLFVSPVVVILGLFLLVPIGMAAWVSVSDWTGRGSPFAAGVHFVGLRNYQAFGQDGLARSDLMTSVRNNFYFVVLVVPLQTVLALGLALVLNSRRLRAKSFFRVAYYFPSVTSSVAIGIVFLFLFSSSGSVNALLGVAGINGPSWFADPRGLVHLALSGLGIVDPSNPPAALVGHDLFGLSLWEWLAGPSVAMTSIVGLVIWVSAGGYLLMFLAALQNIPEDVNEAAAVDGASTFQRVRLVTVPMLRPTMFLVLTLGLIGTWQVFDQIYIMSQGNPAKTTLTPAYLSYTTSFTSNQWGQGAAISFLLFLLIIVLTLVQRSALRERADVRATPRRARRRRTAEVGS